VYLDWSDMEVFRKRVRLKTANVRKTASDAGLP